MTANNLQSAAAQSFAAGAITRQQHDELAQLAALDWSLILKALPALAAVIPALAPFVPIITWLVGLLTNIPNVNPSPTPNGGDMPTPK